jgi:cell volume regulation protein A
VALFIVLGLLVFPSRLPHVALAGLGLTAVLILVARPVAVWVSTVALRRFDRRERLLLGWAGLRGAVPIVLGTFVLSSHVRSADTIFNAVFFVVLVSAVLQGTTLEFVAKQLGLLVAHARAEAPIEVTRGSHSLNLVEFAVADDHAIAGSAVRALGLPRDALVAVVVRGDEAIPPSGNTTVHPGDVLFVLSPDGKRPELEDVFARWRQRI